MSQESIASYLNTCPECGGDIGSEDVFCQSCGARLEKLESQPEPVTAIEPQSDKKVTTVYRPDVWIFYAMLNQLIADNMEGRDGITGDDRRIQIMASNIPALGPIRTILSTEKDFYERLINLADPAKRGFRTDKQLQTEIISIEEQSHDALKRVGLKNEPNFLDEDGLLDQMIELSEKFSANFSVEFQAAYCAWQHYKRSALATLDALVIMFKWVGELAGKTAIDINDSPDGKAAEWISNMTMSRYELNRGFTAGTVEDKNLMQGIAVLAYNIAHESWADVRKDATDLITANIDAICFKVITTQVSGTWSGADLEATERFSQEWGRTFGKAARFLETMRPTVGPEIMLQPIAGAAHHHYDFPLYKLDRESWLGGFPSLLNFKPFYNFPLEPERGQGAVTLIFADFGGGKTTIIDDLIACAVWKGFYVIVLMSDERNQPTYLSLPSFGLGQEIDERLELDMKVAPHPLPTLILNVIRPDEKAILRHVPLTVNDRIITVPNPQSFSMENAGGFGIIVEELEKVIKDYPFAYRGERPQGGVIAVRNLNRELFGGKSIEDLAVATNLNVAVNRWREHNVKPSLLYALDEITTVAPREYQTAGADTHKLAGQLFRTLLNARGRNCGIVGATSMPKKVDEDFLASATTIMFKNLAGPQVEELFRRQGGLIQFAEEAERESVLRLNKRLGSFPEGHPGKRLWIGWSKREQRADLYLACPSPTNTELKGRDATPVFKEAGKYMTRKILLNYDDIDFDSITIARCGAGRMIETRQGRQKPPTTIDLSSLGPLGKQ